MRIGVMIGADGATKTLDDVIGVAKHAEELGLDNVWLANIFSFDAHDLAAGIYFIHASVPLKSNQVRKIVLIK